MAETAARCPSCGHVAATCDGVECYWCPEGYCENRQGRERLRRETEEDDDRLRELRRTEADDRIDPRDYEWVHEGGNPICDITLVASPGGDGNGPAPVIGYLVDGKVWHPSDVTIVREDVRRT